MALRECVEYCPRVQFLEFAEDRCDQRAGEVFLELMLSRKALFEDEEPREHRDESSELDADLREMTIEEVKANDQLAEILIDRAATFRTVKQTTLEVCVKGPMVEQWSGIVSCASVLPGARDYTSADKVRDMDQFETGI